MLAFTSFEGINSVIHITDKNNSVSKTTADHWTPKRVEVTLDKLGSLLELTSKNDNELHLKKIKESSLMITKEVSLFNFDTFKNGMFDEPKNV